MNWNRLIVGILFAGVVGTIASYFVYRQVSTAAQAKPVATTQVVVAATRIPIGARLESQLLRLIPWPADRAVPGMFTQVDQCLNRAVVSSLVENEPILEAKLAPTGSGAGLPATIPEGMRGVSVAVNEVVGVAGFVQAGTMVDVLVTGSPEGQSGRGKITRTVLENVRVLAAGQKVEQDKDGKPQTVPVVTLLVTPEDANKLTMAATEGRIQLALRNTVDTKIVDPPPVRQATLFLGGGLVPGPAERKRVRSGPAAPPRPAPYVVEVIRGGKKETTSFPNQ